MLFSPLKSLLSVFLILYLSQLCSLTSQRVKYGKKDKGCPPQGKEGWVVADIAGGYSAVSIQSREEANRRRLIWSQHYHLWVLFVRSMSFWPQKNIWMILLCQSILTQFHTFLLLQRKFENRLSLLITNFWMHRISKTLTFISRYINYQWMNIMRQWYWSSEGTWELRTMVEEGCDLQREPPTLFSWHRP